MKQQSLATPEHPGHGPAEMLREFIADTLWAVAIHAMHGCDHAMIGDDRMLHLSVHHAICCMKAAVQTLEELKQFKAQEVSNGGSR